VSHEEVTARQKMFSSRQSSHNVTNVIELPVLLVVHVILENTQSNYLILHSDMFTKHDYVIGDPYIKLVIGEKMTQHVNRENPCSWENPA